MILFTVLDVELITVSPSPVNNLVLVNDDSPWMDQSDKSPNTQDDSPFTNKKMSERQPKAGNQENSLTLSKHAEQLVFMSMLKSHSLALSRDH